MSASLLLYIHALPGILASIVIILGSLSLVCTTSAMILRAVNAFAKWPPLEKIAAGFDRGGLAFKGAQAKTEVVETKITTVETKLEASAPKVPPLPLLMLCLAIGLVLGCGSPQRPVTAEDIAYRTVYTAARAVKIADHLCAEAAIATHDKKLADTCAHAYEVARTGLLGVEAEVDAWVAGHEGRVGCAAAKMLDGLSLFVAALVAAKVTVPGELERALQDAARLAAFAAGSCPIVADAGASS